MVHLCGYHCLFVSFGARCNGAYDDNVRVGHSERVTGPYVDQQGKDMLDGGGAQITREMRPGLYRDTMRSWSARAVR